MNIPIRGTDAAGDPFTFQMAFDERAQLTAKLAALLTASGVTLGALVVDVENHAVSASVSYNGDSVTPSVPGWRNQSHLTPYPANYIADRLLDYFGLPGTP